MRDAHLWIEILLWENIARTLDLYVADNSDTAGSKEIVGTLVSISTGQLHQNATERKLRNLFIEVRKKKWFSLLEEPFKFPTDGFPVLEYGD